MMDLEQIVSLLTNVLMLVFLWSVNLPPSERNNSLSTDYSTIVFCPQH